MPFPASKRLPLSCEPCRERKIRCPRNPHGSRGPCETCVRRGIPADECIYLRDVLRPRRPQRHLETQLDNEALLSRIRKLEDLVVNGNSNSDTSYALRGNEESPFDQPSTTPSLASVAYPTPSLSISNGRLCKLASGHERYEPSRSRWSSVLQGSQGIDGTVPDVDGFNADAEFPFSTSKAQIDDLLALLPPLSHCDALRNVYFDVFSPLFHVLHDPSFHADYARFRAEPRGVSFSWLALLFAVLSVAVSAMDENDETLRDLGKSSDPSTSLASLTSSYRAAAFRCLEADQYLWRHNIYTLQAMVLIIYGINHSHGQSWALLGLARNIALAVGCHVDPDAFELGVIEAEQRRRCWAALTMLYTVQNTALGSIDPTPLQTNVKLPMDLDDDKLFTAAISPANTIHTPSQMSYLLFKFRLYDISSRICQHVFSENGMPPFHVISDMDSEISAQQDAWNSKYLAETRHASLPSHHAVHLNILFGYSHQLFLLLHRPALLQGSSRVDAGRHYTASEVQSSRRRCIESARALLGIHRLLHENERFRPYQWYNRGLGSFHAFHAAVVIAYICETGSDLDEEEVVELQRDLDSALPIFEAIAGSGMSRLCRKALPILHHLRTTASHVARQRPRPSLETMAAFGLESPVSEGHSGPSCSPSALQGPEYLDAMLGNLQPQQWLSAAAIPWNEWDFLAEGAENWIVGNG